MLTKLAYKNAYKSIRDYGIYFFTLVLGVCIFYMFNSIYAQKDVMAATKSTNLAMAAVGEMLSYISVVVAVVLGFLIVYANNFFVKRRKKELGIYMTLGMTKGKISLVLLFETSLMAICALLVGLLAGVFGSQLMSIFTAKIFEADLSAYKFVFAPEAIIKSILYFGIIFAVVIVFNTFAIGKFNLIDLIYSKKKSESLKIRKTSVYASLFTFSVICLVSAYIILLNNGMVNINKWFLASIILGLIGTVAFFMSVSGIAIKVMQKNKNLYYRNLNIFKLRQFSSKINTNYISISVVCIVLLLVIGIFSCGYSLQNVMSKSLKDTTPYNVTLVNYNQTSNESIYEKLPEKIKESGYIDSYGRVDLAIAKENSQTMGDYGIEFSKEMELFRDAPLTFVSLSDCNQALKMQGMDKHSLSENQYIVLYSGEGVKGAASQFSDKNIAIKVGGHSLTPQSQVFAEVLSNPGDLGITIVVNDELFSGMIIEKSNLNIQCKDKNDEIALTEMLDDYQAKAGEDAPFIISFSKQSVYEGSVTTKALVAFLAIYLGIVFMITCTAILAIQQLSEAEDNKERYELLKKLGAERKMLNRALFSQILTYFLLPLILAVVHSIVGLKAASNVIKLFGNINLGSTIAATSIFIILIYGLYFILTYLGSKSILTKNHRNPV